MKAEYRSTKHCISKDEVHFNIKNVPTVNLGIIELINERIQGFERVLPSEKVQCGLEPSPGLVLAESP